MQWFYPRRLFLSTDVLLASYIPIGKQKLKSGMNPHQAED